MFATALQLAGLAAILTAGVILSTPAGIAAFGLCAIFVGLAMERDG